MKKIADSRTASRVKRHERLRLRLAGTDARPRLSVFRSLSHIYAQVIDDTSGTTLAAASSLETGLRGGTGTKTDDAKRVGSLVAERAKKAGVAKVHKGGRRFSFAAVIVVGDGNGHVGVGLGKAGDVPESIRKGVEDAKKNLIRIPMVGTTIPHEVQVVFGASSVLLKPASQGTGVIAGGSVRAVLESAGVRDILSKIHGSTNPVNVTRATIEALRSLHSAEELGARRGVKLVSRIAGQPAPVSAAEV